MPQLILVLLFHSIFWGYVRGSLYVYHIHFNKLLDVIWIWWRRFMSPMLPFWFMIYGMSCRFVIDRWFFSLHLWTNTECAYRVAIVLICLNELLIFVMGSSMFMIFSWMGRVLWLVRLQLKPCEYCYGLSSRCNVIDERWMFFGAHVAGSSSKFIITICEFYELYWELWCRGFWW